MKLTFQVVGSDLNGRPLQAIHRAYSSRHKGWLVCIVEKSRVPGSREIKWSWVILKGYRLLAQAVVLTNTRLQAEKACTDTLLNILDEQRGKHGT